MSRTNEDRAAIAAGMSVSDRRDKAAELGISLSDLKAGNWRPHQGATPKPTPTPSPSPSKPKPTPTPSPGPSKPTPTPTPSPSPSSSSWSTAKDKATTHSSNNKRTNEDRAAIAADMSVADRRAKAAELGVSLRDFKAGIWRDKHKTNSSGGGKNYTQDELKDLFPAPPGSGPLPDTPIVGPVQPSPSPSPTPTPTPSYDTGGPAPYVDPYVPPAPVVQPVTPTTSTDTHKGDEKNSPFQSSFVRNYVGFENPYPTQVPQPTNPGTQPQPGTGGGVGPAPGGDLTKEPGKPSVNVQPDAMTWSDKGGFFSEPPKPTGVVKDMPKPCPGTNGTSFTPYSSTDYFNKYGTPAISQQMYINDPYEGSKGQGFYGAAQFTPTNPFTGEPYKLGSNGLPDYGNLYSQGTSLPGQLLPTKKQ